MYVRWGGGGGGEERETLHFTDNQLRLNDIHGHAASKELPMNSGLWTTTLEVVLSVYESQGLTHIHRDIFRKSLFGLPEIIPQR